MGLFFFGFSLSSSAQISNEYLLTERGENYSFGNLAGFSNFYAIGVGDLTIGSINSPSGQLSIQWRYKEDFYNSLSQQDQALIDRDPLADIAKANELSVDETMDLPKFNIKGDVNVGAMNLYAIGTINGNVTVNGTMSRDLIYSGTYSVATPGYAFFGGSYDLGGVTINGDLTASLLGIAAHQPHKVDLDQWRETPVGGLVVNGDVNVDWLILDTAYPNVSTEYDNWNEYLKVTGTMHVKEDLFMGGSMDINKLVVDGTFFNAFGKYVEYPSLPANADEAIHGLNPPDFVASRINELDAKNIQNASNLFVGKLTNDREQVYTQTYGTIRVTDNWFTDSVINMSGGYIDEASLGPDKNLGINNVYNITGGTLIVGDLNFDSTVNLSQDGKIQTDIESIFINPDGDPEALNYIGLNASEPESVKASLTKWFTNYVAGTLRTDLEDHVNFNGGSIVVSGFGKITETQYADLLEAFKEAFLYPFIPHFPLITVKVKEDISLSKIGALKNFETRYNDR